MNTLHFSSAKSWRGGEQQLLFLVQGLIDRGYKALIYCPKDSELAIRAARLGLPCTTYSKIFPFNIWVSKGLVDIIRKHQIDIIHAHDPHAHQFLYLAYRVFGLKQSSVVSRRVDYPISRFGKVKYLHPCIKSILCVSKKVEEIVRGELGNKPNIQSIYSGIDLAIPEKIHPAEIPVGWDRKYILLNVGAICDQKDHKTLILAVEELRRLTAIDFGVIILGRDEGLKGELEQMIERQSLQDSLYFAGFVDDISPYFHRADAFVSSSKYEGLGTSILEAMKYGLPIISTDAGGVQEYLQDGINALLSRVGDYKTLAAKIKIVMEDKIFSQKISKNSLQTVQKYSKERMIDQTIEVYKISID